MKRALLLWLLGTILTLSILDIVQAFDRNYLFSQSLLYCCNDSKCDLPDVTCASPSSAELDDCETSVKVTCQECVTLTHNGGLCSGGTDICWNATRDCYWQGTRWECYK
jgi:hypothetical protein